MTKEQIIENYKKARHITDEYVLDEDEMYFVEELVRLHAEIASNTEIIGNVSGIVSKIDILKRFDIHVYADSFERDYVKDGACVDADDLHEILDSYR